MKRLEKWETDIDKSPVLKTRLSHLQSYLLLDSRQDIENGPYFLYLKAVVRHISHESNIVLREVTLIVSDVESNWSYLMLHWLSTWLESGGDLNGITFFTWAAGNSSASTVSALPFPRNSIPAPMVCILYQQEYQWWCVQHVRKTRHDASTFRHICCKSLRAHF